MRNTIENVLHRLIICDPSALDTGCWEWPGRRCTGEYGQISFNGKLTMIHRLVYEHFRGSVPEGMELDHRCRNRVCCNVDHLDVVTSEYNRANPQPFTPSLNRQKAQFRTCPHGERRVIDCKRCMADYHRSYKAANPTPAKTHCPSGHPLKDGGLRKDGVRKRYCSVCLSHAGQKGGWPSHKR